MNKQVPRQRQCWKFQTHRPWITRGTGRIDMRLSMGLKKEKIFLDLFRSKKISRVTIPSKMGNGYTHIIHDVGCFQISDYDNPNFWGYFPPRISQKKFQECLYEYKHLRFNYDEVSHVHATFHN